MTVDRAAVLDALREVSAEGFATSKQVAAVLGIKGASPLIRTVRKELEVMARQGRIETEVHPTIGKRFRYVEEPDGIDGIVARMERRAKDLMAAGIGEKTHGTVYQHGWCERTALGYAITDAGRARIEEIERDWPELRAKGRDVPVPAAEEQEPKMETMPAVEAVAKAEAVLAMEQMPAGYDGPDPLPDDPPMTEAENAVVEGVEAVTVYRLTLRTARGVRTVDVSDPYVIGKADATAFLVGMAARVRTVAGRVQIGHIVDDEWRDAA